ncbi:MAG: O-antigen ligase family protein [Candidatus Acetothermia bacterium]|jgi:O-antigen ligase|nr:O-antigen ligase family protein [Candidatus Acetothermia bacterium]
MVLERPLRWILIGFCFVLPLIFSPLGYQYSRIVFALIVIPLLVTLYALMLLSERGAAARLALPLPFVLGLGLLVLAGISLINSANVRIGLESLALLLWALLFYLLVANLTTTARHLRQVLLALFLAGSLAALYGLLQYYGYTLFPRPQRLPTLGPGNLIATMGNKNYLASYLGPLIPIGLFLLLEAERRWERWAILVGLALSWAAGIAGGTRSVWLGLALAAVYGAVSLGVSGKARAVLKRSIGWLASVGAVLVLIALVFILLNPLNKTEVGKRIAGGVEALSNPYVRYYDWWIGWEMGKSQPLIGSGLGDFKIDYSDYKARFLQTERGRPYRAAAVPRAMQAHNEYIQGWAELGGLGMALALAALGAVFYGGWRGLRAAREERGGEGKVAASLALQAGIVVLLGDAFFSFPLHLPASALELVLFAGLLASAYLAPRPAVRPKPELGRAARAAFCGAMILLAGATVAFTVRDLAGEVLLQRGERLLAAGSTAEATAALERSLKLDFAPKKVLFDLGLIYMDSDLAKAEAFFLRSLRTSAADPAAYLNLTEIARARGEYEKALDYARRGRELEPTELEFLYLQTWLTAQLGRISEALPLARQLIASNDGLYRAKAYALVGDIYFLEEHREEAILNYQLALAEVADELGRLKGWEGRSVSPEQYRKIMDRYEELKGLAEKLQEALKKLEL